jgi:hypothetical protein
MTNPEQLKVILEGVIRAASESRGRLERLAEETRAIREQLASRPGTGSLPGKRKL